MSWARSGSRATNLDISRGSRRRSFVRNGEVKGDGAQGAELRDKFGECWNSGRKNKDGWRGRRLSYKMIKIVHHALPCLTIPEVQKMVAVARYEVMLKITLSAKWHIELEIICKKACSISFTSFTPAHCKLVLTYQNSDDIQLANASDKVRSHAHCSEIIAWNA